MNNHKCFHYSTSILGLCAMILLCEPVLATDWTDKVIIHGFATAALQKTDQSVAAFNGEVTEGGLNSDISTLGTRYGLNISADVNDRVTLGSQFFATRGESYNVHLDWAFVNVNLNENLDLRAGRLKYPGALFSEVFGVGYAYPWIDLPQEIYSEHVGASQAVHESFSGISLLATHNTGNMTYSANLYGGEVSEEFVNRRDFLGLVLEANWDDKIRVQAATNTSVMQTDGLMPAMDGENHDITQFGIEVNWNNVVLYSEFSDVDMGAFKFGESKTGYVTLGYRFGKLLPHITVANLEKSQNANSGMVMPATGALMRPFEQTTTTLGLRWDFMESVSAKFEIGTIELDSIDDTVAGYGMFDDMPDDDSVTRYGIAIDAVF